MKKGVLYHSTTMIIVLALSLLFSTVVMGGTKNLVAGKKLKFEDDSVESMRDVLIRREGESKEYREKMLSNSKESIVLLKEIRDLLKQLNEEK